MELIARRILIDPVEILVGGRSVVNSDITQYVEIRPEDDRFFRLLEILGKWFEEGKVSHESRNCLVTNFQTRKASKYTCS